MSAPYKAVTGELPGLISLGFLFGTALVMGYSSSGHSHGPPGLQLCHQGRRRQRQMARRWPSQGTLEPEVHQPPPCPPRLEGCKNVPGRGVQRAVSTAVPLYRASGTGPAAPQATAGPARTGKRRRAGGGQWRGPAAAASQWGRGGGGPMEMCLVGSQWGAAGLRAALSALPAPAAAARPSPLSAVPAAPPSRPFPPFSPRVPRVPLRRPRRAAWPGWAAASPPSGAARTPWCGRCLSRCAGRRCAAWRAPRWTSPARRGSISCMWVCCGASWGCRCWSCRPTKASPTVSSWRMWPWSARRRRCSPARARPAAGRR